MHCAENQWIFRITALCQNVKYIDTVNGRFSFCLSLWVTGQLVMSTPGLLVCHFVGLKMNYH